MSRVEVANRKSIGRSCRTGNARQTRPQLWNRPQPVLGRLLIDGPLLQPIMSAAPSTSTSRSSFASIFNAALETYKHKTKKDLSSHPLLSTLQLCDSPEAILTAFREQISAFGQSENGDDGLTKWVAPTVNVLYSFSATLGGVVGLVCIRMTPREEFLL